MLIIILKIYRTKCKIVKNITCTGDNFVNYPENDIIIRKNPNYFFDNRDFLILNYSKYKSDKIIKWDNNKYNE